MKDIHHYSRRTFSALAVLFALLGATDACESTKGSDSQTNWLSPCKQVADCDPGLECLCGICTATCATGCGTLGTGAACITVSASAGAACTPAVPAGGVCSLSCAGDADCTGHGSTLRCVGGACLAATATSTDAGRTAGGDAGLATASLPLLVSIGQFTEPGASGAESNSIVRGFLPPRCVRKQFGSPGSASSCFVDDCLIRRDGNLYGLTGISAGVVTIHGGTGADVVLTPDQFGVYPVYTSYAGPTDTPPRWHAGDSLRISATGGDVPAFSTTLSFLTPLVLTAPDPASSVATVVDRTKGLTVTWTPTDETVSVGAVQVGPGGDTWDQIQGTCDFPGGAGSATLSPEFFTDFPAGASIVYAGHSQVKASQAGSHPLRLITINGADSVPITVE